MSNGPLPSKLALLSSLHLSEVGEKVRFLGCVKSYATQSATLTLDHGSHGQHDHGALRVPDVRALVDVKLLLEGIKSEQTRIGEWVNVIGYITRVVSEGPTGKAGKAVNYKVHVQALLFWSAGPLDVGNYEICMGSQTEDTFTTDHH